MDENRHVESVDDLAKQLRFIADTPELLQHLFDAAKELRLHADRYSLGLSSCPASHDGVDVVLRCLAVVTEVDVLQDRLRLFLGRSQLVQLRPLDWEKFLVGWLSDNGFDIPKHTWEKRGDAEC